LHTRLGVTDLLSGILMMTALYSVNLHVMGRSNLSLLETETLSTRVHALIPATAGWSDDVMFGLIFLVIALLLGGAPAGFLKTDFGSPMRSVGDIPGMITRQGVRRPRQGRRRLVVGKQGADRLRQPRVAGDPPGDERQRPPAEDVLDVRRPDVGRAIAEGRAIAGPAVVQLVRMHDHQLSGQGMTRLAAIVAALHALERHADGVGVVAMRGIGCAREARLDPVHGARGPDEPVFSGGGQPGFPSLTTRG